MIMREGSSSQGEDFALVEFMFDTRACFHHKVVIFTVMPLGMLEHRFLLFGSVAGLSVSLKSGLPVFATGSPGRKDRYPAVRVAPAVRCHGFPNILSFFTPLVLALIGLVLDHLHDDTIRKR